MKLTKMMQVDKLVPVITKEQAEESLTKLRMSMLIHSGVCSYSEVKNMLNIIKNENKEKEC